MISKNKEEIEYIKDHFPEEFDTLSRYSLEFRYKPKFWIEKTEDGFINVLREDYLDTLRSGIRNYGHQITIAEIDLLREYRSYDYLCPYPSTKHSVFLSYDEETIIKEGNEERNNASFEFNNVLQIKYFRGIIEFESPLGFRMHPDNEKKGLMLYKPLKGMNLYQILKKKNKVPKKVVNSLLWDIAKLFSRLIENNVFFYDSHRFNNLFIENTSYVSSSTEFDLSCSINQVLRVLDGEFIFPRKKIKEEEKEYMVKNFIHAALEYPLFLDKDRLEDFLMVTLGNIKTMKKYRDTLDYIPRIELDS